MHRPESAVQASCHEQPAIFVTEVECGTDKFLTGMPKQQRLLQYATSVAECPTEAFAYGRCVSSQAERVKQHDCQAEFKKLLDCVTKQLKKK
ncbi:unnamed protein product [Caenorhabditis auriculariae]|uniref:CHCH domain-containing protein n=1 Tax=Caenorhabditis auriculariae TaxID=2777116 RepID=A0A8S1H4F5_9PELO|nr:unnamed protein product [Caenorhabditis auriculariae]